MKRILLASAALTLSASAALSCDTFTSKLRAPGERTLRDTDLSDPDDAHPGRIYITEGGITVTYWKMGGGTDGGPMWAGIPREEATWRPLGLKDGVYSFGDERFVEYCK